MSDEKAGWEVEGFIDRLTRRDETNSERLILEAISHLRAFSRDCDGLKRANAILLEERVAIDKILDSVETLRQLRIIDAAEIKDLRGQKEVQARGIEALTKIVERVTAENERLKSLIDPLKMETLR